MAQNQPTNNPHFSNIQQTAPQAVPQQAQAPSQQVQQPTHVSFAFLDLNKISQYLDDMHYSSSESYITMILVSTEVTTRASIYLKSP